MSLTESAPSVCSVHRSFLMFNVIKTPEGNESGGAAVKGRRQAGSGPPAAERSSIKKNREENDMAEKLKVLFLCTGNSCRSQMAEGWARFLKCDVVEPYSAGIETHGLNRNAVRVMAESGVDIGNHRSKHLDEVKNVQFDWVITVCDAANESCPVFYGKVRRFHVSFDDPPKLAEGAATEEEALSHYRRVRDEIRRFVETLPGRLNEGA